MSNSDFFAAMTSPTAASTMSAPIVARSTTRSAAPRRWWPVVLVAGVVAVAFVAAVVHLRPHRVDTRPVVLPVTFDGEPPAPAAQQFAQSDDWRPVLAPDYAGNAFDGRAYGTVSPVRMLNVVVARTDGTGIGDVKLGAAPFTDHGDVRCTRTIQLRGQAAPGPTGWLLCFRAERDLTISVLALGAAPDAEVDLAAAVDDLWARQG